jgi:sulfur carrier protein
MKIYINGESLELDDKENNVVAFALSQHLNDTQSKMSFAVAINGDFIAKESYATTTLSSNDSLDVLFPIVGG